MFVHSLIASDIEQWLSDLFSGKYRDLGALEDSLRRLHQTVKDRRDMIRSVKDTTTGEEHLR